METLAMDQGLTSPRLFIVGVFLSFLISTSFGATTQATVDIQATSPPSWMTTWMASWSTTSTNSSNLSFSKLLAIILLSVCLAVSLLCLLGVTCYVCRCGYHSHHSATTSFYDQEKSGLASSTDIYPGQPFVQVGTRTSWNQMPGYSGDPTRF